MKGAIGCTVSEELIDAFQSAPPVKGAILQRMAKEGMLGVSIRAPREGGDENDKNQITARSSFNPRPP